MDVERQRGKVGGYFIPQGPSAVNINVGEYEFWRDAAQHVPVPISFHFSETETLHSWLRALVPYGERRAAVHKPSLESF